MNSELFDLCKEVYEKTEWETKARYYMNINGKSSIWHWQDAQEFDKSERVPIYTSDYLLEKLRETKRIDVIVGINRINEIQCYAKALNLMELHSDIKSFADTPLKALLKLTIALSEAGELK